MFQALHEKRFSDALSAAEAILAGCPLDLDAHLAKAVSLAETRQPDRAGYHRRSSTGSSGPSWIPGTERAFRPP